MSQLIILHEYNYYHMAKMATISLSSPESSPTELAELPNVSSNMSPPATRRSKSGVISLYPVLMNLKLAVCKVLVSKWVFMSILNLISVSKVSVNYGIGGTLILRYVVE